MKTKTTNGKTVVVATEQDLRTLDRAIDVLIEYSSRLDDRDEVAHEEAGRGIDGVRSVALRLLAAEKKPTPPESAKPPAK